MHDWGDLGPLCSSLSMHTLTPLGLCPRPELVLASRLVGETSDSEYLPSTRCPAHFSVDVCKQHAVCYDRAGDQGKSVGGPFLGFLQLHCDLTDF